MVHLWVKYWQTINLCENMKYQCPGCGKELIEISQNREYKPITPYYLCFNCGKRWTNLQLIFHNKMQFPHPRCPCQLTSISSDKTDKNNELTTDDDEFLKSNKLEW